VYSAGKTVPSTAQIRAEGNNTKCVGKKRFNGSVTHGLRKEHVFSYRGSQLYFHITRYVLKEERRTLFLLLKVKV
jgi:hypothetical protein